MKKFCRQGVARLSRKSEKNMLRLYFCGTIPHNFVFFTPRIFPSDHRIFRESRLRKEDLSEPFIKIPSARQKSSEKIDFLARL
jgi:hypothetical protein